MKPRSLRRYQLSTVAGIVAVAGVVLAGCTSHGSVAAPAASASTVSVGATASTPGNPATAADSATPAGGSTPAGYPADPKGYAQAALAAWQAGNQVRLDQLRAAGNQIFANLTKGNYDKHFQLYLCDGAAGSTICTFYNAVGDDLQLRMGNTLMGQPHAVLDGKINPITFPADAKAYGQLALDAWINQNTNRVALLTSASAQAHFDAVPASLRSAGWTYDHGEGAAGSSYLSWRDPAGDTITFRFLNDGVDPNAGPKHRIIDVLYAAHP